MKENEQNYDPETGTPLFKIDGKRIWYSNAHGLYVVPEKIGYSLVDAHFDCEKDYKKFGPDNHLTLHHREFFRTPADVEYRVDKKSAVKSTIAMMEGAVLIGLEWFSCRWNDKYECFLPGDLRLHMCDLVEREQRWSKENARLY